MRIGMILDSQFPPDYRVEKEALTLVSKGHQVFLFCLTKEKKFYQEDYKGIVLAHYPSGKLEYKLSALAYTVPFYHWMMKSKIADFLRRYSPETIHVHDMVIAEPVLGLAKRKGLPVTLDLHENRPASMREYRHLNKFPGKWLIDLKQWERKQIDLVNRANHVVTVTQLAKDDLLRQTVRKDSEIIVVPNTSSYTFRQYPLMEDILDRMKPTFNLLYIGDTSLRRGTADALYAVDVLKEQIPNLKLWILGTSSADHELREIVRKKNLDRYVQFEGWQPEKLFATYITGSHVCISPLRRNPHHDTTFANKIFQYMSLERPIVVSDCPAQALLVEQERCGLVHIAADIQDLADKIMKLYKDSALRTEMGQRAQRAVMEKWNWEETSVPLVKLYETLAAHL
jgi:glycosyltransferase involved in cell wall biosynthesis